MAKKKVTPKKSAADDLDSIIDSPEIAMSMVYKAEAHSMAEMFEESEDEQEDLNKIANEATAEEVKELMSLSSFPEKKKKSKK